MPFFNFLPFRRSTPLSLKCAYLSLYQFYKKKFQAKVFSWRLLYVFDYNKNSILSNPWAPNFKNLFTEIPKIKLSSFNMKNMKDSTKFIITKNIQIKIVHLKSSSPCPTPHPLKDQPPPPPQKSISLNKTSVNGM